jgi:1,4-alpha-glucan branching enzyme
MRPADGFSDLWEIAAASCGLADGRAYHYWFEVSDSHPDRPANTRIQITDPAATLVDWRLLGPSLPPPYGDDDRYPAAVIQYAGGKLACPDIDRRIRHGASPGRDLAPNNHLVIYELPTTWTRSGEVGGRDMGVGSFRDVAALVDAGRSGANFDDLEVTQLGRSYLTELGVNALELLPPADSTYNRQWGYGTTNYFAPDFELGFPFSYSDPVPNRDLAELVRACRAHGIRFFADVVMAFSKNNPYLAAACDDFFLLDPAGAENDPDAPNSRGTGELRNGYGASLFRYARMVRGYDPISGETRLYSPARQLMKTALARWSEEFGLDGLRLDSVENVQNWDFVQEYKDLARELNRERYAAEGASGPDERFLVVGEELSEPLDLLRQGRLDGLWHERFKHYVRMAILGRNHESESSFEETVRKAIDCRAFGFTDLSQAVIYLTSHDVEGFRNERLYNFLRNNGVSEAEKRIKLAFACLLTAAGVPMILAGEEFADEHDLFDGKGNVTQEGGKQVDPVNFTRVADEWRVRIREYVSRLVRLRASHDALAVNDTSFIHVDFSEGKRVLAWQRGVPGSNRQVVVVANFSDYGTPDPFRAGAEYVVQNWPAAPPGARWREIPQDRDVPTRDAGREPIFPWEAKVYALV